MTDVETALLSPHSLALMSLELQIKLYRSWAEMIGERLYWLEGMFTDLLEQRGAENASATMTVLHQRYQS
jgi:hypothetical protein